jgi:hypothetical protein
VFNITGYGISLQHNTSNDHYKLQDHFTSCIEFALALAAAAAISVNEDMN